MTEVRQNIESQLNEVAFLQNLYGSVKVSPHNICEEFQAFVDGKLDDVYNQLTCTIILKVVGFPRLLTKINEETSISRIPAVPESSDFLRPKAKEPVHALEDNCPPIEVEVSLPHSYPHTELRLQVSLRGANLQISRNLQQFVNSLNDQHPPGTFCISLLIDHVIEKCEENPDAIVCNKEASTSVSLEAPVHVCRVWLVSHHIYDKVKRRKLVELCLEKSLGGFCLPGKPGVICLEGESSDCSEAVAVIKSWNWQKIGIKFEEKSVKHSHFHGDFKELACYKANQGAGERPHMDLGMFSNYLEDHNLGFAFYELFGIERK